MASYFMSSVVFFIIYYLLFIIYYLLFIIYYLLFIIYYLLFIIYFNNKKSILHILLLSRKMLLFWPGSMVVNDYATRKK